MHKDVKHRKNWFINLSKQKLTETETDVLRLGLNFGVTQKTIPKQNIIAEVEIPNTSANIIRGKIVNTLNQPNTHQPNLTSEQRKALQILIKQVDLVITRADKGNCTVILDKSDYEEKMHKLLNDNSTYMLLKHDLNGNIERKLKKYVYQLFKTKSISQNEYYHLHSSDANAPRIYGLPKIHKPQTPLRPIVFFINSPLYNFSKFFTNILSPLVGNNGYTVKNSYEFIDSIAETNTSDDECLASFDVISLFTKILIDIAKSIIFNLLNNDKCLKEHTNLTIEELVEGLNLCLDNTYIQFRENYYKQIFGVPMGSPISVTIANVVIKNVENRALQTFSNSPTFWKS